MSLVEAGARRLQPEAWRALDDRGLDSRVSQRLRDLSIEQSRVVLIAALEILLLEARK
jgi:hypothetical protein